MWHAKPDLEFSENDGLKIIFQNYSRNMYVNSKKKSIKLGKPSMMILAFIRNMIHQLKTHIEFQSMFRSNDLPSGKEIAE